MLIAKIVDITIAGNWINQGGIFAPGTQTVTFDGTNQTINGSTTFYNFAKSDANNDSTDLTLTFDASQTQTIQGTFKLDGLDGNDRINLVSDDPGVTSFIINFTGVTATRRLY